MRLNYMWSQPLIEKSKKAITIYIYIYHSNYQSWALGRRVQDMNGISISLLPFSPSVASWISSPVACAAWPAAVTPEFPTKAPVQVKDGPKGPMGMGWYGLTWERGKRSTLRKINSARTFVQFLKLIGCDKCFPVYICIHDDLMDKWTRFNNSCLSLPQALKITSWNKQSWMFGGISDGFSFKFRTALNQ